MHRRLVLGILERYLGRYPEEFAVVDHVRQFVRTYPDCFERSCLEGHITGSAWVVSADRQSVLLTHHAKLDQWFQLGGHADGESDPFRVALSEAREESGMTDFIEPSGEEPPLPLDIDVHQIPARSNEAAHLHFDVRYLLIAQAGQVEVASAESHELRWVRLPAVAGLSDEESLLRMVRKTPGRLQAGPPEPE